MNPTSITTFNLNVATDAPTGLVLLSPNGTRYVLSINDGGGVQVVESPFARPVVLPAAALAEFSIYAGFGPVP